MFIYRFNLHAVYDEAIPIVDYTLLVVTGETLALAYELPHQPIYEDEFVRQVILNQKPEDSEDEPNRKEDSFFGTDANGNRVQDSYYFGSWRNSTAWQNYLRNRNGIDSYYTQNGASSLNRVDWNDAAAPM